MNKKLFFLLIPIVLVLFIVFLFRGSEWDGTSRFRLTFVNKVGDTWFAALIPDKNEVQIAKLPADREVEAAFGLGTWKLSSLWKLGEQEKIGGSTLVRDTLIQGLQVPVEGVWVISGTDTGRWNLVRSLATGSGDLTLATRLRLISFMFRASVKSEGELRSSDIQPLAGESINSTDEGIMTIVDQTGEKSKYIESMTRLIENLGGKVLDIADEPKSDGNCIVYGKSTFARKLASVLECTYKPATDVQKLVLMTGFLKRF